MSSYHSTNKPNLPIIVGLGLGALIVGGVATKIVLNKRKSKKAKMTAGSFIAGKNMIKNKMQGRKAHPMANTLRAATELASDFSDSAPAPVKKTWLKRPTRLGAKRTPAVVTGNRMTEQGYNLKHRAEDMGEMAQHRVEENMYRMRNRAEEKLHRAQHRGIETGYYATHKGQEAGLAVEPRQGMMNRLKSKLIRPTEQY